MERRSRGALNRCWLVRGRVSERVRDLMVQSFSTLLVSPPFPVPSCQDNIIAGEEVRCGK